MLWTSELSQRSPLNGLQSGKPPILHILRLTTLFLGLVCHSVPLNLLSLWQQRLFQKEAEIVKEWAEHYRTVKKRTARNETTKDKAGALPPVVCEKAKSGTWIGVSFPDSRVESLTTSVSHELVLRSTLPPPPPRLNLQIVLHFHAWSQDQVPEEQVWCRSFIKFDPVGEVARPTANYIISSGKHK